jgi:ATP-dependent helicase/nuclease subunit B
LLRSPHLQLAAARDVTALDRALAEDGYLGGADALERLLDAWREVKDGRRRERALRAGDTLLGIARELAPLRSPAPVSAHLQVLVAFLSGHEAVPALDEALRARHLRARAAVLTTLVTLRDAFARHDPEPVSSDDAAALVRRWIEAHTFAPRAGDSGVHVVDADSARFGRFEHVHLAGVIDDEWPERPRRSIFYSPAVLKELGWPAEVDRRAAARAAFVDLLRLPSSRLSVSRFLLEADALVSPSPLLDELEHAALDAVEQGTPARRIFESEALYGDPLDVTALSDLAREWAERRQHPPDLPPDRFRGQALPLAVRPFSLSALERYQDCPFKFFAADILGLEEDPEDESTLSPRARGRFVHEVFQRFYEAWEAREGGAITSDRIDEATALMHEVAEPLLARLPDADAALERARLFGSAISTGSLELVLSHEASSGGDVRGRLLEHRLEGEFTLGSPDGRHVALRGVADRVDLLAGNRLRLVDYKTGSAPVAARALQAAIYALCAQERLQARDGRAWEIEEVVYLAFSGKRPQVSIVKAAEGEPEKALGAARDRLRRILDRIAGGQFPPQPHDPIICDFCAYASVCRKDYVHD